MHPLHDLVLTALRTDLGQMVEEGHTREALTAELDAATGSVDRLLALQEDWWQRPSPPDFPYDEPSDWPTLAAGFPAADSHARLPYGLETLADRLHAAWLGRAIGCQLGKPLEGLHWPERVERALRAVGSWPLADYMNALPDGVGEDSPDWELLRRFRDHPWTRGRFRGADPDDDLHYALVNQTVLERHGTEFTTEQMIAELTRLTPGADLYAAGRNMWRTAGFGFAPPATALFGNPCRQSLGAMIRCDAWGWVAPANPALAAALAWRDAVGSQTRNGIYAGVFFAVLLADTLATSDPVASIDTALAYVPPRSRFAEMVAFVREQCAASDDWQAANAAIYARWPAEAKCFNHSLPNAAIVLLGLLAGGGDFTRTLGITVMAAMDTDCTGATVGSLLGCALGLAGIPAHWSEPLDDTLRTHLAGLAQVRISEVAGRLTALAWRNARTRG